MMFFTLASTFIIILPLWFELCFLSSVLHLHSHEISFIQIIDWFFPVTILRTCIFISFVLFRTHCLLEKSLRVLQRPTHLFNLTSHVLQCNSWLYSLGCKLIRVDWILHFWLLKDTHFVWLVALTMPVNNTINIFLIIPKHYFIKTF